MKPRLWPYVAAFLVGAALWTGYIMNEGYQYWQSTGQEAVDMGSSIRNGILALLGIAALAYAGSWVWLHRSSSSAVGTAAQQQLNPAAIETGLSGSHMMLAQTGQKFVLEVRGMGVVVGDYTDEEIWQGIEEKADNHATYLSQKPEDYTNSPDQRLSNLSAATGFSFKRGARYAVDQWPLPVIIWYPPKSKQTSRPAGDLAGLRQQASLGVTLLLWQEDANTDDGAGMIEKLFSFFDTHPDVPAALIFTTEGSMMRSLVATPGHVDTPREGHVIPAMPDSVAAFLVTRSDRVDKLIRPFAVQQRSNINKNDTEYDIVKLWNFFWKKNDDRGPESFNAHYIKQEKAVGVDTPAPGAMMTADWWQAQLPELWKTISNQGPGNFKPTPYIPVRWTDWQLKQFDSAPLLGYLHRPIDVKLTDDKGQPLKTALQAAALKAGWEAAVATLPENTEPKRVFYDTTGNKQWVIPLNQALMQMGASAPHPDEVKEGYDIGARIGDTGTSSSMVQIGLGLIASYHQGGASATVNRRPNGMATIIMVSPPDEATKAAWAKNHGGKSPFD
ncbi:hypothetical protein RB25_00120 [Herbaspirillum rubrisubalbicans]|uniref:DUF2875 domain-containing protein n=1 Tax=Herbaspirillum rubrisubalbicans TaxID=80842 RepID=A0ABX9BXF0_9BURK|nr:DUF2875 family protein [Herbaspirillum rubrisubalbicans]RAM62434.1 hypothetical protein RB24_20560 [Herbaspirillum rubrisubalbicans]RAN50204.1 hypothetical protein RB25_00120 [Herbaspirillum rubrisubalbicans]